MKKKILYEKYREQAASSTEEYGKEKIQGIRQMCRNVWDDVVFIVTRGLLVLLISFMATILMNKPLRDTILEFFLNAV